MLCDALEEWDGKSEGGSRERGYVHAKPLQSCPTLAMPWTKTCQAPLSMRSSRKEYWSMLLCPPPRDLLNPEIEPVSLMSPALALGLSSWC